MKVIIAEKSSVVRGANTIARFRSEPFWELRTRCQVGPSITPGMPHKTCHNQEPDDNQDLPEFTAGEAGPYGPHRHEGKTKPPRYFTGNSLLGAMEDTW